MPNGARIHLIASDVSCTVCKLGNHQVVSGFRGWGFVGWDMRSMVFLGYPRHLVFRI